MTTASVLLTIEEWVEHFAMEDVTAGGLDMALSRVGRVNGPALLADMEYNGMLTTEMLAARIGGVWSMAEYPDQNLSHEMWRDLFATAGYTADGKPAFRPDVPQRLYRGSVPERRADWSWTDNREVAAKYAAGGLYGRPAGKVWAASVEPWRLLARNTERDEHEYVVDTEGLAIHKVVA